MVLCHIAFWHHGIRQACNFVSVEEQQEFASDTVSFLKTILSFNSVNLSDGNVIRLEVFRCHSEMENFH